MVYFRSLLPRLGNQQKISRKREIFCLERRRIRALFRPAQPYEDLLSKHRIKLDLIVTTLACADPLLRICKELRIALVPCPLMPMCRREWPRNHASGEAELALFHILFFGDDCYLLSRCGIGPADLADLFHRLGSFERRPYSERLAHRLPRLAGAERCFSFEGRVALHFLFRNLFFEEEELPQLF